jgi:poly-gamma-glutamate capsule biosynthesis protein CapA/YwtB (metallophosphatase superfamily)
VPHLPSKTLLSFVLAAAVALASGSAGASDDSLAAGKVVRLAAAGDIAMIASPDSSSFFRSVDLDLRGDLVLGNLEGTLTGRGASKCGAGSSSCYAFRAPPSYAGLLRAAGFTVMNLANNHAYDFGSIGQHDTVRAVHSAGLLTTGRPGEIAYLRTGTGVRVAVVGFAPYPWAQSLLDLRAAKALVQKADTRADVVIATMHAGAEGSAMGHVSSGSEYFLGENRGDVYAFAHAVIDAGADAVIGHGPHVLRGMEWYKRRLIAYSLGNFLGWKTFNVSGVSGVSGILQLTLNEDGSWVSGALVPVTLAPDGIPRPDPEEAAHGVVRRLSKQDFGRRGIRVSPSGVLRPPR